MLTGESGPIAVHLLYFPVIAVLVPPADLGLNMCPSAPRNRPGRVRCPAEWTSVAGNSRASIIMPAVGTWGWSSRGWTSLKAHQGVVAFGPSSFAWQMATCSLPQVLLARRRVLWSSAR